MPASRAEAAMVGAIRVLALAPDNVWVSHQAQSDLMAHGLTVGDVCAAIVGWIDAGFRVKPTTIKNIPARIGQAAYEMKPRLNDMVFYVKVVVEDADTESPRLSLLSAHPDH